MVFIIEYVKLSSSLPYSAMRFKHGIGEKWNF